MHSTSCRCQCATGHAQRLLADVSVPRDTHSTSWRCQCVTGHAHRLLSVSVCHGTRTAPSAGVSVPRDTHSTSCRCQCATGHAQRLLAVSVCHGTRTALPAGVIVPRDTHSSKLQALVYNFLPSTPAVFIYAIGSRKLSANEQFFVGAPNSSKFVTNNSN